ncbi:MAG: hypothetical protein ACM3RX_08110 [Methanococcaceae archaeon]
MDEMNIDKYLDDALKNPDLRGLNNDIASKVMMRIQRRKKQKQEQKRFFIGIVSVFAIISLAITGTILYKIIESAPNIQISLVDNSVNYFNKAADFIYRMFPSGGVSIIGSVISLGLIITAYFYFDLNKAKLAKHSR